MAKAAAAAAAAAVLDKLRAFWDAQYNDEENRALNYKVLKAGGLFAGSIFLMHNFGELMVI